MSMGILLVLSFASMQHPTSGYTASEKVLDGLLGVSVFARDFHRGNHAARSEPPEESARVGRLDFENGKNFFGVQQSGKIAVLLSGHARASRKNVR